jgi:hypothetical protein
LPLCRDYGRAVAELLTACTRVGCCCVFWSHARQVQGRASTRFLFSHSLLALSLSLLLRQGRTV